MSTEPQSTDDTVSDETDNPKPEDEDVTSDGFVCGLPIPR